MMNELTVQPEKLRDIKRANALQYWIPIINECCNSGQTKKAWCKEHGIDIKSFYYYQRKLYNTVMEEQTKFIELKPVESTSVSSLPSTSVARLTINGVVLELCPGVDSETVTSIVRGLKNV